MSRPGSHVGTSGAKKGTDACCSKILQTISSVPGRFTFPSPPELADTVVAGKKQPDYFKLLHGFLQKVNASLNSGGGCVLVHLTDPYILNKFDEKTNELLDHMIADNSYFHDNFESKYIDENHVAFWVRPKERHNTSTLSLPTKVMWNGSLRDAKQGQVREHVVTASTPPQADDAEEHMDTEGAEAVFTEEEMTFIEGKVVTTKDGVFQESISKEAKSLPAEGQKQPLDWLFRMEKGGKLPGYITAFAKLDGGGSYYIGVEEEKQKVPVKGKSQATVTEKTGKFICKGVPLSIKEKEDLRRGIQDRARDEMMWLSAQPPQDPVSVIFHPVQRASRAASLRSSVQTEELYVIEVKVKHLKGLAFWTKEGPLAFTDPRAEKHKRKSQQERQDQDDPQDQLDAQPVPMTITRWLENNGSPRKRLCTQTPCFSKP